MFSYMVTNLVKVKGQIKALFERKPDRFITHLLHQAEHIEQGLQAMVEYMEAPTKPNAKHLRKLEKSADAVRRLLIDDLNHTFVTPIDREDISELSRDLDDVIDYAWSAVHEMDVLNVKPTPYLQKMANLLLEGADELRHAIVLLSERPSEANHHAVRALGICNKIEGMYAEALSDLFDEETKKIDGKVIIQIMKLRESYRHMFHAGRSICKASNTISDIVVKFF